MGTENVRIQFGKFGNVGTVDNIAEQKCNEKKFEGTLLVFKIHIQHLLLIRPV